MADPDDKNDISSVLLSRLQRSHEIRLAALCFPGLELGEAYRRWKISQGNPPPAALSTEFNPSLAVLNAELLRLRERPCPREGCTGTQLLESVCSGCVEGRAGYVTKWTCNLCLHRELSKKEFSEWIRQLSLQQKQSSSLKP